MVEKGNKEIEALAEFAVTEPKLAYAAYTFGTSHRWDSVCRTTPNVSQALKSLNQLNDKRLIPALVGANFIQNGEKYFPYQLDLEN